MRRLSGGDELYNEFDIPKKAGGLRHVENPARELKLVQAKLARTLSKITPPDYLFCPVKGRCYVSNAAQHIGSRVVKTLDIKKYFPSTSGRRVYWFFRHVMMCKPDVAGLLTSLSTYQNHLPTGSPLSPIMAYFAHIDVWNEIAALCAERGYILTVYVDDCTVSGATVRDADIWAIKQIICRAGLRYHKEKRFIDRPAEITGVIVTESGLRVPHRQFRKLRKAESALSRLRTDATPELVNQARGLKGQIAQIQIHDSSAAGR